MSEEDKTGRIHVLRTQVGTQFKEVAHQLPGIKYFQVGPTRLISHESQSARVCEIGKPDVFNQAPFLDTRISWVTQPYSEVFANSSINLPMVRGPQSSITLSKIPLLDDEGVNTSFAELLNRERGSINQNHPFHTLRKWVDKPLPMSKAVCYAPIPSDGSFVPLIFFDMAVGSQALAIYVINNGHLFPAGYIIYSNGIVMYPQKDGKGEFIALQGVTQMTEIQLQASQGLGNRGFFDIIAIPIENPNKPKQISRYTDYYTSINTDNTLGGNMRSLPTSAQQPLEEVVAKASGVTGQRLQSVNARGIDVVAPLVLRIKTLGVPVSNSHVHMPQIENTSDILEF
ncbi:MAG: hypothetical protein WCO06_06750 [Candidatus Roizmanbacteria bacterium]